MWRITKKLLLVSGFSTLSRVIANTNDGSNRAPRLSGYMSELALDDMHFAGLIAALEPIRDAGYDGIKSAKPLAPKCAMDVTGSA